MLEKNRTFLKTLWKRNRFSLNVEKLAKLIQLIQNSRWQAPRLIIKTVILIFAETLFLQMLRQVRSRCDWIHASELNFNY